MELIDGVKEGDGERVLRWWKYGMLLFKITGHKNYSIEALTLLAQHQWFLPPRQKMQLKFSRFVNIRGKVGTNLSCDYYMEQLNRLTKICIQHLGANKADVCISKVSKCIGPLNELLLRFDEEHNICGRSANHKIPTTLKDRDEIIKELVNAKVFDIILGRAHRVFATFTSNLMRKSDRLSFLKWMNEHIPIIKQRTINYN